MSGIITEETQQIDVSNLPDGVFFVIIGDMVQKLIVQ